MKNVIYKIYNKKRDGYIRSSNGRTFWNNYPTQVLIARGIKPGNPDFEIHVFQMDFIKSINI